MSIPLRFGILGLGMGANRARLVTKTRDAELVCVCDLQREKAKQIASELNCEWTTRYDEMLGSEFYGCYGVLSESNAPKFRSEYVNNIKKVREVVREGIVNSAHDLSIGGLAVGICKMALKCGAEVRLESNSGTLNTLLFSETYGRFVLGVEEELVDEVLSKTGGQVIGKAGGGRIKINDILLDLSDVQTALSSLTKTMIGDENERK